MWFTHVYPIIPPIYFVDGFPLVSQFLCVELTTIPKCPVVDGPGARLPSTISAGNEGQRANPNSAPGVLAFESRTFVCRILYVSCDVTLVRGS